MKELTNLSYKSVRRYFRTLSSLGYKNYKEVDKLIILLFIEELLSEEMSYFITEKDYEEILKGLNCLYGSTCLIDFPTYKVYDDIHHKTKISFNARISEDNIFRSSQDDILRVKA